MGGVSATFEVELPLPEDDEQPEPPASDPVADVLSGVARGVGHILGGIWDAIKPDDSQQPPPAESEDA